MSRNAECCPNGTAPAEVAPMLTVVVILAVWALLSLPLSVVLGLSMKSPSRPELIGMDGDRAVYRDANGALHRVSLVEHTPA